MMVGLELLIKDYIEKMMKDYNIIGAMLAGSYVTGNMKRNSDIDIFFIWNKESESMRGREFYKSVEFEYFISPEWKYRDRLKNDLIAQQIYANGKIVLDSDGIFKTIQQQAINIFQNYNPVLSISEKIDYSFYVETIMNDGIDILGDGQLENFYFFSGKHIPKFCDIIGKLKKKYPIYEKYAIEQLKLLDENLFYMITGLYNVREKDDIYKQWVDLCRYVLCELGDVDIKNYQVISGI